MRNDENPSRGKIEIGAEGLGTVTLEMIETRAAELAKMDGRPQFNEADLQQARAELQARVEPGTFPEVDERTENIVAWDEPPAASGRQIPTRPPDDEANVAEQLVTEGIEEAEHSQRLSAADDDTAV